MTPPSKDTALINNLVREKRNDLTLGLRFQGRNSEGTMGHSPQLPEKLKNLSKHPIRGFIKTHTGTQITTF